MRKVLIGFAAAATLFAVAAPAMAQDFRVRAPGVSVRVGDHDRGVRHRHHHYRHYARDNCRQITVRERRPNGTVVVRKTVRCR